MKRFLILCVFLIIGVWGIGNLLLGCGQGNGGSGDEEEQTTTWDSASEEAAVKALALEDFEIFPVDLDSLFFTNNAAGLQLIQESNLKYRAFGPISPFSMHDYGGNHTEGRGKWYFTFSKSDNTVYMPCHGILTSRCNESLLSSTDTTTISEETVYKDTPLQVYVSKHTILTFGHLYPLVSIQKALEESGYITLTKGQKVGYWSGTGGEIVINDGETNNGIASIRYANLNTTTCPMKYFSSTLRASLESFYQTYIYDYIKNNARIWPQSKYDSPLNINVTGEVWGTWWYKSGLSVSAETKANWMNLGIIALLSYNDKINHETFDLPTTPETVSGHEFAGIYNDIYYMSIPAGVSGYERNYLYSPPGYSKTDGTFIMLKWDDIELEPANSINAYLRYKIYLHDPDDHFDDELYLGFGSTSEEASSALNSHPLIYGIDGLSHVGTPISPIEP